MRQIRKQARDHWKSFNFLNEWNKQGSPLSRLKCESYTTTIYEEEKCTCSRRKETKGGEPIMTSPGNQGNAGTNCL